MPGSPLVALAVALGMAAASRAKARWPLVWVCLFALMWIASALGIRFAPRHKRDDYRDAARMANAQLAEGKRVWWVASDMAAGYYNLPITGDGNNRAAALAVWRPEPGYLQGLPEPDVVYFSKPPIFDTKNAVTQWLEAHHYHVDGKLAAFTIWAR
jgi:hypothetical protein